MYLDRAKNQEKYNNESHTPRKTVFYSSRFFKNSQQKPKVVPDANRSSTHSLIAPSNGPHMEEKNPPNAPHRGKVEQKLFPGLSLLR